MMGVSESPSGGGGVVRGFQRISGGWSGGQIQWSLVTGDGYLG